MHLKDLWPLIKEAAQEWSSDNASRLGAALAYYTVFSLAPLLVIVLFVIGSVWEGQAASARAEIVGQMRDLAGPEGADLIQTMLDATRPGAGGVFATVLSVIALLFGATGVFAQLQGALNTVWDVKPEGRGIKGFVIKRLLSFGVVLTIGFLLLISLVISALISSFELTGQTGVSNLLLQLLNFLISIGIITLLFALMYRYLPDVEIAWHDVWIGAAVTALLFTLGKLGIGLYLGNSSTASTYGAAGALAVLMVWVYYSAQILFFGAELTQVYARRFGSHIRPASYAVKLAYPREDTEPRLKPVPVRSIAPHEVARPEKPVWKRALPIVLAFFLGRWLKRG